MFKVLEDPSTRTVLMRAGIDSVRDFGIDRVSASDVITRAGVSRPTFYSYFGDVPGMLADTWVAAGGYWFDVIARGAHDDWLLASSLHSALCEMLLVAPRTPELLEVMQRDLDATWTAMTREGQAGLARHCWTLGLVLGTQASLPVLPDAKNALDVIPLVASMPNSWKGGPRRRSIPETDIPSVSSPAVASADEVTATLLESSIDVVSRSGVEKASMSRICRAARVTTGSAKPRFDSTHDLLVQGFDRAMEAVVAQNLAEYGVAAMGSRPWDAFAAFTVSGLHPSRTRWRRYRQEMHVAARVDQPLARHLRKSFRATNAALAESLAALGIPQAGIDLSILLNHVLALGFGMLSDLGLPVASVKHLLVTDWLEKSTGLTFD